MNGKVKSEFRSALVAAVEDFGLESLTDSQIDLLTRHFEMLTHWNRRINLTRIIEPHPAAKHHYAESLFGARFIGTASSILDIGAGAGFPSVPIAVFKSDIRVTALEANQKKTLFLNEVKDALSLANFEVARARFEEFDRAAYDLLTSRALDRAETVFLSIVHSLEYNQKLMLFCSSDLAASLEKYLAQGHQVETHRIPQSESRIIAIFSRK